MNYQPNSCVFIGLPNSGKSSFIAALWHVVQSGEIESIYSVSVQPHDREYLNALRKSFLECKPVERTKTDFEAEIELDITETLTGNVAKFIFPDLSGETFQSQFEDRKLSISYAQRISACSSIMLFVNPNFIKKGYLISDAEEMFAKDEIEKASESANKTESNNLSEADGFGWSAKLCQTQVVLVDLLQIVSERLKAPCKINVIISAWDVIRAMPGLDGEILPEEWIKSNLPLLYQFLLANSASFAFKIFGVSAQGGNYSEVDDENLPLQELVKQSERIIVQEHESITHDITVPLKWLFE
jgi:Double-GTPase 1